MGGSLPTDAATRNERSSDETPCCSTSGGGSGEPGGLVSIAGPGYSVRLMIVASPRAEAWKRRPLAGDDEGAALPEAV